MNQVSAGTLQIQAQIPARHLSPVTLGQQVGEVTAGATVRLLRGVAAIICEGEGRREDAESPRTAEV